MKVINHLACEILETWDRIHMYEQHKKENYLFYFLLTHTPHNEKSADLNF